jgi:hypothetical protein
MAADRDDRPQVVSCPRNHLLIGTECHHKLWGRFSKGVAGTSTAAPHASDTATALINLDQGRPNTADESRVITGLDVVAGDERAETQAEETMQLLLAEVLQ